MTFSYNLNNLNQFTPNISLYPKGNTAAIEEAGEALLQHTSGGKALCSEGKMTGIL